LDKQITTTIRSCNKICMILVVIPVFFLSEHSIYEQLEFGFFSLLAFLKPKEARLFNIINSFKAASAVNLSNSSL
ncbi:18072_t:CDS:1, partial [Entrophospora sp. SA101]